MNNKGFTFIELIVSVAIIGTLMAFSIVKFRTFNQGGQINIVAQKIVSDIRKTQSYALGLKEYNGNRPEGGWGVYFNQFNGFNEEFVIYPDYNGSVVRPGEYNHLYNANEREEVIPISNGIWIDQIAIGPEGGPFNLWSTVNITFEPPEPHIFICDATMIGGAGVDCDITNTGDVARIRLTNGTDTKTIEINRFGLVDLLD